MAKVFVSYSRKDTDFAKKLTGELQKNELDFWIDWEGIPPTVDWWREIEKGIEEADVFLFIISPDSATSKICGQEIDTAVKNGKRIIPIVTREIEWEDTPSQLGHLNYIFFSREDDFDTATNKLLTAIQTDYEWAATHRRLQVKALEWERNNKENSFLLRGKDLQDAEGQLATNTSKEPHPTDLQREHIFASRKATDRQRRILTGISIAGIIALAALAVFGFVKAGQATDNAATAEANLVVANTAQVRADNNAATAVANEEEAKRQATLADEQARIARVGELSALALSKIDKEYDLALLLSIEAYKSRAILQSQSALYATWVHNPALEHTLRGHANNVNVESVAWSNDERLASAGGDGTVIIWDIENSQPAQVLQGQEGRILSVAWSNDGRLASGSDKGTIIIWNLESGQPAQILQGHSGVVNSVAWSGDGRLASASDDGTVIIWDIESGQPAQILQGHSGVVNSVAWSVDGRLASAGSDVIIWDLESGQPTKILQGHEGGINSVAWSNDGRLASGANDHSIIIWDLESGQIAQTLKGHPGNVYSVAWSDDGQLASTSDNLVKTSGENAVIIWDLESGQPAQFLQGHGDGVASVAWSAGGRLATASWDSTVIVWDSEKSEAFQTMQGHGSTVWSVAWSEDGRLASGSRDKIVIIWDLEKGIRSKFYRGIQG